MTIPFQARSIAKEARPPRWQAVPPTLFAGRLQVEIGLHQALVVGKQLAQQRDVRIVELDRATFVSRQQIDQFTRFQQRLNTHGSAPGTNQVIRITEKD
jgi:hypothetical protein